MIIHEMDPKWLRLSKSEWLAACVSPARGLIGVQLRGLLDELAALFPQPGVQTHPEIPVVLRPGQGVATHSHPEHLLVYYPMAHAAPIIANMISYTPIANTAVYLPPGIAHEVPKNDSPEWRISVALRWQTATV